MSNGAPLQSTKLVKIISKVAFWQDKSFSSPLGQYFVTLFLDEVAILGTKIYFRLMGT